MNRDVQLRVRNVGFLVTKTHRSDKALVFDGATGESWSDECGLGDLGRGTKSVYVSHALRTIRTYHTLPALLLSLLSCLNHREHLFLRNTLDLR